MASLLIKLWIIALVLIGAFIYPFIMYSSSKTVKDCIVKTERVVNNNESKYVIFGKNEVYENTDSLLRLKFNSSDFYRDIEAGKCYTFKVQGWRIPFFSSYRNIYQIIK